MVCYEFVFAEERKNLFPISLMGATIQDGSSRERRGLWSAFVLHVMNC